MNILIVVFVILTVVLGFGYVAIESDSNPTQAFSDDVKNLAKAMTTSFPDGSVIEFALDPQPPVTEFIYEEITTVQDVIQEDGTIIQENVTKKVAIKTSTGDFKTTANGKKICNLGYTCQIEGRIQLVDLRGDLVSPPYGFFMNIGCEGHTDCQSRRVMVNELTDSNGGFKYRWTTSQLADHVGDYTATVHVRSAYDVDGEKFTYDVIPLQIELIL